MNNLVGATFQGFITVIQQLPDSPTPSPDGTVRKGAWLATLWTIYPLTEDLVDKRVQVYVIEGNANVKETNAKV